MTKNILIVENQITQFNKLYFYFESKYNIFPPDDQFYRFMNLVRISLNRGYGNWNDGSTRSSRAYFELLEVITGFEIDLIIMDHILIDSKNALNGIDFARRLRLSGITVPILFLSNSQPNTLEIGNIKSIVKDCEWLGKNIRDDNLPQQLLDLIDNRVELLISDLSSKSLEELYADFKKTTHQVRWSELKERILSDIEIIIYKKEYSEKLRAFFRDWSLDSSRDITSLHKLYNTHLFDCKY